jgi:hypothetical protein
MIRVFFRMRAATLRIFFWNAAVSISMRVGRYRG